MNFGVLKILLFTSKIRKEKVSKEEKGSIVSNYGKMQSLNFLMMFLFGRNMCLNQRDRLLLKRLETLAFIPMVGLFFPNGRR